MEAACDTEQRRPSERGPLTDRRRWEEPSSYEAFWWKRAAVAAALARKGERVCDIGCGAPQSLRALLPRRTRYYPADLRRWTPDVLACDLNAADLPTAYLRQCDVAYLLGVIEYVHDVPALFRALADEVASVVVSYNCADFAQVDRAGYGWVNAFTADALRAVLTDSGFSVKETRRVEPMELIIRAQSHRYSPWKRFCRRSHQKIKVFLLLFLQKKKNPYFF